MIGDLTSIIDDSIQFYFNILTKDTALQGAVLVCKRIQPEYKCKECELIFAGRSVGSLCPRCGGKSVIASKGQEFYIESIEVEDSED